MRILDDIDEDQIANAFSPLGNLANLRPVHPPTVQIDPDAFMWETATLADPIPAPVITDREPVRRTASYGMFSLDLEAARYPLRDVASPVWTAEQDNELSRIVEESSGGVSAPDSSAFHPYVSLAFRNMERVLSIELIRETYAQFPISFRWMDTTGISHLTPFRTSMYMESAFNVRTWAADAEEAIHLVEEGDGDWSERDDPDAMAHGEITEYSWDSINDNTYSELEGNRGRRIPLIEHPTINQYLGTFNGNTHSVYMANVAPYFTGTVALVELFVCMAAEKDGGFITTSSKKTIVEDKPIDMNIGSQGEDLSFYSEF